MPEVKEPQTTTTTTAAPDDDPLAHLHRMSTTAGLGTQEYVAINVPAVVAALLGVASILSLLANELLLIPLAGVVCSILALRQIGNSNGTQGGKGYAILGLLLSLGFACLVGGLWTYQKIGYRDDERAIGQLMEQFSNKANAGDWKSAYGLFSDRFRDRVTEEAFVAKW